MKVKIYESKYPGLKEFIEEIKNNNDFSSALRHFTYILKNEAKEGKLSKINKIKSKNIDELLDKIDLNTELNTDEMVKYAGIICEHANIMCDVSIDESKNLVVKTVYPEDFNPKVFKDFAFLYWVEKKDKDKELSDKEWRKFKEYYENFELPESLFDGIKDFESEMENKSKIMGVLK